MLRLANDLYLKGGDDVTRGLALFDLERGNMDAGQGWAAANVEGDDAAARSCNDYPGTGAYVLNLRLHPRAARVPQDAPSTQRPGTELHPAVEPPDDLLAGQNLGRLFDQRLALQPFVLRADRVQECLDCLWRELRSQVGSPHAVPASDFAGLTTMTVPDELSYSQGTSRVAGGRLYPDLLERAFP